MSIDPEITSWPQGLINLVFAAVTGLMGIILALIGYFVNRHMVKVDEMAKAQAVFITREEFREEINKRLDDMDTRRLQLHNQTVVTQTQQHTQNLEMLNRTVAAIEGLRADFREDLNRVHARLDKVTGT